MDNHDSSKNRQITWRMSGQIFNDFDRSLISLNNPNPSIISLNTIDSAHHGTYTSTGSRVDQSILPEQDGGTASHQVLSANVGNSLDEPLNWPSGRKYRIAAIYSIMSFISPLASSMLAPASPLLIKELDIHGSFEATFVISVYVLGNVAGPLLVAPCSEVFGRRVVFHVCNLGFILCTIACALSKSFAMLVVFRLLSGCFAASPTTLGGPVLADMFTPENRTAVLAFWSIGPLLGPVIGPIAGGFLSQAAGWRWICWTIAIAAGLFSLLGLIVVRETYLPVLQQNALKAGKQKRLHQTKTPDSDEAVNANHPSTAKIFLRAILRPFRMLATSPIVLVSATYMAISFGYLYLLISSLTIVFQQQYHFSIGIAGLCFLGLGVGFMLGLVVNGRVMRSIAAKGKGQPESKLFPLTYSTFLIPIGLLWYGWSANYKVQWICPVIGTSFIGIGYLGVTISVQTYLIEAFGTFSASALAANVAARSVGGAFIPLAAPKLYGKLGLGWGNSLLSFIALAMWPLSVLLYKHGDKIRNNPRFQFKD